MKPRGLVVLAIVAVAMARHHRARARPHGGGDEPRPRGRLLAAVRSAGGRAHHDHAQGRGVLAAAFPVAVRAAPAPAGTSRRRRAGGDDAAVQDLLSALDLAESDRTAQLPPAAGGLVPPAAAVDIADARPARWRCSSARSMRPGRASTRAPAPTRRSA
jgi:hypothetical protein